MGKSIRSKIKKKNRAIRRKNKYRPAEDRREKTIGNIMRRSLRLQSTGGNSVNNARDLLYGNKTKIGVESKGDTTNEVIYYTSSSIQCD